MDTKRQVEAARGSALAIRSARATLVVTGTDRLTWLNGLVTCDLAKKRPGEAAYGLVVARSGRVLADMLVVVAADRLLLAVPSSVAEALMRHFEHYIIMEDVQVASGTDSFETWEVHGPEAAKVLATLGATGGVGAEVDRTGLGGAIVFVPRGRSEEVSVGIGHGVSDLGGVVGDAPG